MGHTAPQTNRQPEAERIIHSASGHHGQDPVNSYFECITACSVDDGECVTRCVEVLRDGD
ncbi:hypothetical protein [Vulcanococcus sp.]|jgi:hypothetical protein|uniref:hypothetical protein n=1 Tax=Vulcanococcus sp. TaxID=2856995 RepID=UPI0037D996E4